MTQRIPLTTIAHNHIKQFLKKGDIAIDATLGNGYDTLFLARQVGESGIVYGFDIQKQAIQQTKNRLLTECPHANFKLIQDSHETMLINIPSQNQGKISVIMFNLGYLPGGDKTIITQVASTLNALNQSLQLLAPNGLICLTAYPGHAGGKEENRQIKYWCNQLTASEYTFQLINSSDKETAPKLYIIQKIIAAASQ